MAIALIIAAIAIPRVLGMREKSRRSTCDALFAALDGEIANALDSLTIPPTSVIAQVILAHKESKNPRNKAEPVYVHSEEFNGGPIISDNYITDPATDLHSCQVQLAGPSSPGELEVRLLQAETESDESGGERSVRIGVD